MKYKKEFIIGLTVVAALALLLFGIQFLKGINAFNTNRTFYASYDNIQGLVAGSTIQFKGNKIGVVQDNILDENNNWITVLNISNSQLVFPIDSKAKLETTVLGESSIQIILGDSSQMLQSNDTIKADYKFGITELATQKIVPIETKVNILLNNLNKSLSSIDTVLGTDGRNLRRMMASLQSTVNTLNTTVKDVDNVVKSSSADIKSTLQNVSLITENLKNSNDKVTNLISNFSDISDSLKGVDFASTVAEAKAALAGVTKIMDEINNGTGSVHQLIYSDSLVNNVNAMLKETERLVTNIKEHPKRYLQFAVFGGKEKGLILDAEDERKLQELLDSQP
ncbi:MlaD family protein [Flavobacteriales bacterium]|nr:MlaD family protein [Flavobacteriales bacterium]